MSSKVGRRAVRERAEAEIVAAENLVIDAQFLIQELLNRRGLTQSELADAIGVRKARITQLMRSDANPSLRSLAEIFHALGDQLCLQLGSRTNRRVVKAASCSWLEEEVVESGMRSLDDSEALSELLRLVETFASPALEASNDNPWADDELELAAAA